MYSATNGSLGSSHTATSVRTMTQYTPTSDKVNDHVGCAVPPCGTLDKTWETDKTIINCQQKLSRRCPVQGKAVNSQCILSRTFDAVMADTV